MNPRDMLTDALHNFHPQYQQYTQYPQTTNAAQEVVPEASNGGANSAATVTADTPQPKQAPKKVKKSSKFNEKTMLLSDDEDF